MTDANSASDIFEQLQARKRAVDIEGRTYWLVEGDLLMDEDQLWGYALRRAEQARAEVSPADQRKGLIGMSDDQGRMVRWRKGKVLSYCVRRATFAFNAEYDTVVSAIHASTKDWEATCGVNFRHAVHFDTNSAAAGEPPLFDVIRVAGGNNILATAFFPNDPVERRHVYIYPPFFAPYLPYDHSGILRHELGHVLGFRHEHIRSGAPPDCPGEELMGRNFTITDYDPKSVMHYYCPQSHSGTQTMQITDVDRAGAQQIYGAPDHEVTYYD